MAGQVKSKQRVADHGEVFTADREVKAMCDLVSDECLRIDSRFLEPACGDGNFLAEILQRKLNVVRQKYSKSKTDYEKYSILALTSLYGVDILQDNCQICRERLFNLWNMTYESVCKKDCNDAARAAAKYILECNIVCGNALSMMCVDRSQQDTSDPIIFAEWAFVTPYAIKRRDFRLDVLLKENEDEDLYDSQLSIFADEASNYEYWDRDPETMEPIPKPIREYKPIHYRRLPELADIQ